MPAGLAYWRHGSFSLYAKNPPLIKLWTTLPLELGLAGAIQVPAVQENPLGWGPWNYGQRFEAANAHDYLKIFTYARTMVILLSLGYRSAFVFRRAPALGRAFPPRFSLSVFCSRPRSSRMRT